MLDSFIKYNFSPENAKTLVFLPGASGGLDAPIISKIVSYFSTLSDIDVLGIEVDYSNDTVDLFDKARQKIKEAIKNIHETYPEKEVILIAKSLSGSLCLHDLNELKVKGLVILGFPIVLGWPQRTSLLSEENPKIPDYKSEWVTTFSAITTMVRIINGSNDDLTDNDFLKIVESDNKNISLVILKEANHSLVNKQTKEVYFMDCVKEINELLK